MLHLCSVTLYKKEVIPYISTAITCIWSIWSLCNSNWAADQCFQLSPIKNAWPIRNRAQMSMLTYHRMFKNLHWKHSNIHQRDKNYHKWQKPYLGKNVLEAYFEVYFPPMSYLVLLRGRGLWPILQTTIRGQEISFHFISFLRSKH